MPAHCSVSSLSRSCRAPTSVPPRILFTCPLLSAMTHNTDTEPCTACCREAELEEFAMERDCPPFSSQRLCGPSTLLHARAVARCSKPFHVRLPLCLPRSRSLFSLASLPLLAHLGTYSSTLCYAHAAPRQRAQLPVYIHMYAHIGPWPCCKANTHTHTHICLDVTCDNVEDFDIVDHQACTGKEVTRHFVFSFSLARAEDSAAHAHGAAAHVHGAERRAGRSP